MKKTVWQGACLAGFAAIGALLAMPPAYGAQALPRHLTGAWGTAESLFEGTAPQIFVFLAADGAGALIGSGEAPTNISEPAIPGEPAVASGPAPAVPPRAIMGFPVRATLAGDVLTLQVTYPAPAEARAKMPAFICRHDAAAVTLACRGPDGTDWTLRFRGDTIPADAAQAMALARQ